MIRLHALSLFQKIEKNSPIQRSLLYWLQALIKYVFCLVLILQGELNVNIQFTPPPPPLRKYLHYLRKFYIPSAAIVSFPEPQERRRIILAVNLFGMCHKILQPLFFPSQSLPLDPWILYKMRNKTTAIFISIFRR